jgi:hypothetical protein
MPTRASFDPWVRAALLGAVLGTIFLGVGGRAAMRVIAVAQGAATGFSLGGSGTVVFLGTVAGIAAGLIYAICRQALKSHVWWARLAFGVILLAIVLRGLRPIDGQRLLIFLPLFVLFSLALDRLWQKGAFATIPRPIQSEPKRAT